MLTRLQKSQQPSLRQTQFQKKLSQIPIKNCVWVNKRWKGNRFQAKLLTGEQLNYSIASRLRSKSENIKMNQNILFGSGSDDDDFEIERPHKKRNRPLDLSNSKVMLSGQSEIQPSSFKNNKKNLNNANNGRDYVTTIDLTASMEDTAAINTFGVLSPFKTPLIDDADTLTLDIIDDFDNFDNFPNTDSTVDHNSAQAASIEKISISKSGPIEAQPIFKTKEIVLSSLLRDPRLFRNRNFEPIATNPKLLVTNHTKKDNDCRATTVSNVSPLTFPSIEQGTNPKEAEIVDNMDENIDECGKDEEVVLLSPRSRDPRLLKNRNATKSKVAKINQEKCDNDCRVTDVSIASPITSPLPLTEHNSNDKEAVIDDNSDENIDEFDEDDDILSIFDEEENHIFADESDNGEPSSKRLCTFSQNTKTKNVITSTNDKTNKKNAIEKLDQTPKTMPSTSSCNNSNESIFKIPKLVNNDRSNPIEIEKKSLILTKRKTPTPVVNRKLSLQSLLPGFHLINANRVPIKQRLGQLKNINSARMLLKPNQNATVVTASPAVSLPPEQVEKTIQAAEQLLQKSQNAQQLNKLPEKIASKETVSNCSYLMPSFVVNPYEKEPAFNVLFMNVCRNFINGGCTLNPARCPFIHTMPENDFFRQALNKIGQKHVIETYNVFILRCPKLFEKYFPEFCDYFGSNSLEQQLIQMVNDCTYVERRIFMFLKNIVNAFVKMGMPYSMALRKLIGAIKKRTIPTTHTVLKLILDRQNKNLKPFFDILQSMTEMDGFVFPTEAINRLLLVYDQEKNQNLLHIIWLIIANLTPESQQNIDGDLFTAFLDNLTKNIGPEYKMSRLAEKIVPTN